MADNVVLNLGSGGDTVALLDVGGVKHEKVIVEHLVGGVPVMTEDANPFPVIDSATLAQLVLILAKLSSDPATEATQTDLKILLDDILSQLVSGTTAVSGTVTVDTSLLATENTLAIAEQDLKDILTIISTLGLEATLNDIKTLLNNGINVGATVSNFPATQPVSLANGSDLTQGFIADAIVAAGATGTVSAKLRRVTQGLEDLKTLIVLAAGTNLIGKVGIDQTTPGTTNLVALAANQSVKEIRSATPSQSSPAPTNSSTSILASNANRLGGTIYNESGAVCYVKLGATASITSYSVQILVGGYYEIPFNYTGAIDGITAAGTAVLRVTEIT